MANKLYNMTPKVCSHRFKKQIQKIASLRRDERGDHSQKYSDDGTYRLR